MTAAPAAAASATAITGTRQYLLAGIMANSRGSTRPPAAVASSRIGAASGVASRSAAPGSPLRSARLAARANSSAAGQARTGEPRQQPHVAVAVRGQATAAQVVVGGEAVDPARCQQRHPAVTDQRHTGLPRRQPSGRQPPIRADVRGEGNDRFELWLNTSQERGDVGGQGHEARNL